MKLTRKNIVMMGLLLSSLGLVSAQALANEETTIPEVASDYQELTAGEEYILSEEMLEEFRQDCQEIAVGEGISEADQPEYVETCIALSIEIERQAMDEMNGENFAAEGDVELPLDEGMTEDAGEEVVSVVTE